MNKFFSILAIAFAALTFTACGDDEPTPTPTPNPPATEDPELAKYKPINSTVRDLALIYQGGTHRIDWTEAEFMPYLTHTFLSGKEEWLFDGYLFLEFTTGNNGFQFTPGYNGNNNARKEHWEWYLDRVFEEDKAVDALNKAIEKKKAKLGDPGFKHKVCLTIPVPISGQKDWGELDGVALNFNKEADRMKAGEWFVDQLISRFDAGKYQNLELYGIYMICEEASAISGFVQNIKKHIASSNLEFVWIPYFGAAGAGQWEKWGFDIAYQQPNHFFREDTPDERLDQAIQFAKNNGMALEFECDERALSQSNPSFQYRMVAYMDAFERHGIWYDTPVAYYTGNHLFLDFARNPTIENTQVFDRVCKYIVNRRKASLK